jgi:cytosine/adenosine deaminase-related metal-dependent hydrolase
MNVQNGIVVTVSPMVRVYNASGIMLQLRCRRANNDSEGVVVILEDGNAIDDSMGAFNALNMDGEKRKTLSSFNLGSFFFIFDN